MQGDIYFDETTQNTQYSFFAGKTGYKGRPASEGNGDHIPANNPVLNLDVVLQTAKHAAADILEAQRLGGAKNWPWFDVAV